MAWLLALPFLLLSRPSPPLLLAGAAVAFPGLLLRGLAAARIHKDRSLAVRGPYAVIRHPLYLGSFLLGAGLAMAGGRWFFLPLFVGFFLWAYGRTIRTEERQLAARFGEAYQAYRSRVPAFLPRLRPLGRRGDERSGERHRAGGGGPDPGAGPATGPDATPFRSPVPGLPLYLRNREWESALGTAAGFALLWLRMVLGE